MTTPATRQVALEYREAMQAWSEAVLLAELATCKNANYAPEVAAIRQEIGRRSEERDNAQV